MAQAVYFPRLYRSLQFFFNSDIVRNHAVEACTIKTSLHLMTIVKACIKMCRKWHNFLVSGYPNESLNDLYNFFFNSDSVQSHIVVGSVWLLNIQLGDLKLTTFVPKNQVNSKERVKSCT